MANRDDTSKPSRSRRNQGKDPAAIPSAKAAAVPAEEATPPPRPHTLEAAIEYERTLLLQVRAMLHCLYEVLLYADDDDSIMHAEVACTAARLINDSAIRLDAVNLQPLIEAIRQRRSDVPYEDETDFARPGPYQVREAVPVYLA